MLAERRIGKNCMADAASADGERDARGDWRPAGPIAVPPFIAWPPPPLATLKWVFGVPGYLWPTNCLWLAISLVTWFFLTPDLAAMRSFELWWIALLLARNFALVLVFFGGLHLHLFVARGQGNERKFSTRPLATGNPRFLFSNQVRDNMVRSLAGGVPVFTAYEAVTYWGFANGYLGFHGFDASPLAWWIWFAVLMFFAPVIHAAHFYFTHRLLHWPPLYRSVHRIHHTNVEIGPWSGLAMHPVEQVVYFSTVVVSWLLAPHPLVALFQIQIAALSPALGHSGFDTLLIGRRFSIASANYFHYLHHRYFECNYGGTVAPFDKLFGTFHDGTPAARTAMRERMRARHLGVS
jgi:sterol desaturase/sphingolipid hydroxylase (fatty acid hydroxylase superfamily)